MGTCVYVQCGTNVQSGTNIQSETNGMGDIMTGNILC